MKVALYARVSTEQQIDNYSIPLQRERLEAFCTSKGWTHTQEYIDAGGINKRRDKDESGIVFKSFNRTTNR